MEKSGNQESKGAEKRLFESGTRELWNGGGVGSGFVPVFLSSPLRF